MAATGHWARWKHTWASGMWPSSAEAGGEGVWPGVSPQSCLHCHPSLGPEPTHATSHWASGFDQTSLQSFHFIFYWWLSYVYGRTLPLNEATQSPFVCVGLCLWKVDAEIMTWNNIYESVHPNYTTSLYRPTCTNRDTDSKRDLDCFKSHSGD